MVEGLGFRDFGVLGVCTGVGLELMGLFLRLRVPKAHRRLSK